MTLEKLYLDMEGISEVELGTKKVYAKVISDNLKSIDERHLDLLHYVIDDKSIKEIKGINYKSTDIFALKEYLLDLLHCEKVHTIKVILGQEEEQETPEINYAVFPIPDDVDVTDGFYAHFTTIDEDILSLLLNTEFDIEE